MTTNEHLPRGEFSATLPSPFASGLGETDTTSTSINTDVSAFLNVLFAGYAGDLPFVLNEEITKSSDPEFIAKNTGALRVRSADDGNVFFVFDAQEDTARHAYLSYPVKPSAVLWKDGVSIYLLALDNPVPETDACVVALMEHLKMDLGEAIPLPGTDGWELVNVDADNFYTADELAATYLEEIPEESVEADQYPTYGDAKIITPYNESDYKGRLITVSIGANQFSKLWQPQQFPLATLIHQFTSHKIGKKDGLAIILGDMVKGQRKKQTIKTCTAIGLDIDTGTPSAEVDAALAKLGCLAIRSTTHSHGKQSSEIRKDSILKFRPEIDEITTEIICDFLLNKEHWHESIVKTVKFVEEDHTDKGIVCRISHAPMPKHRVIVPVIHPYVIADEGRTQQEAMAKWAKVPAALAEMLGVPFDTSCTDPSRLYYLPRHDKSRPYEISLFGGPLFDLKSLRLDGMFDAIAAAFQKGGSKSVTAEGKALGKWWVKYAHGFQIMDVIQEFASDRVRSKATSGYNIECPFDSDHGNAGDSSDQACFAVNAADGGNEFFLVSCRHESCRDKTSNDMLGRMLKDEWFEEKVLYDQQWNVAEIEEEAPQEFAKSKDAGAPPAGDYQTEINKLTAASTPADIEKVVALCAAAKLSVGFKEKAFQDILKKLGKPWTITTIRGMFTEAELKNRPSLKMGVEAESGGLIYHHPPKFDFHEACEIVTTAIHAKNKSDGLPTVSTMGAQPVLMSTNSEGKVEFEEMNNQAFWSHATSLVKFVEVCKERGASEPQKVPEDVAKHVFQQSRKNLRQAPLVIYAPMFLRDGSLLVTPGYHYDEKDPTFLNHLLILQDGFVVPKISEALTLDDALASRDWIREELLNDFPFSDIDANGQESRAPGEAHSFALLLTPFMRRMIPGRTPVFATVKPKGGTGGTLLNHMMMLLCDGKVCLPMNYNNDNDSENSKEIITNSRGGNNHMFYDDVEEFDSRSILRAVTSPVVGGRLLGGNVKFECLNGFNWLVTGNNPRIPDQMVRRSVFIRMNAKKADVASRKFRHGGEDLEHSESGYTLDGFVEAHRGEAVAHLLTLIEYWIQRGRPAFTGKPRHGFEGWSAAVGGVLEAVGVEGFLQGKSGAQASVEEAADRRFVQVWHETNGVGASLSRDKLFALTDAVPEILKGRTEDAKRDQFFGDLQRLDGQTVKVRLASGVLLEVMVQQDANTDHGLQYSLVVAEGSK